jgi:hypothetical protein
MHAKKVAAASALLTSALFSLQAEKEKNRSECREGGRPFRVAVRHIEPNGIGYRQGYTTAEGFFPLYDNWDKWVFFLDARGHVFNNGQPAVNAGLGGRYLTTSRVWGLNAYYDYRKTSRFHYNQVGGGFESLGAVWDFRVNGYAPVGKWTTAGLKKTRPGAGKRVPVFGFTSI